MDMGYNEELPVTTSLLSSLSCLFSVEATEAPPTAAGAGGAGVATEPDVAAAAAHGHHALLVPHLCSAVPLPCGLWWRSVFPVPGVVDGVAHAGQVHLGVDATLLHLVRVLLCLPSRPAVGRRRPRCIIVSGR